MENIYKLRNSTAATSQPNTSPFQPEHVHAHTQLLRMSLVITVIGFKGKISNIKGNSYFYIGSQFHSDSQDTEELKNKNYTLDRMA